MNPRTFVVLGGAGAMGRITAKDLTEFAPAGDRVVIADYNFAKARFMARLLSKNRRVESLPVDVSRIQSGARALRGCFAIINCVQYQFNLRVMAIALAAGAHYVDLGGLFHMTRRQLDLDARFRSKKLLAILGMGAAPGITNLLAWRAAQLLDKVSRVDILVAGADRTRYRRPQVLPVSYSLKTILEEFSKPPAVFEEGRFKFLSPMSADGPFHFPSPVGTKTPIYTLHSEVATLPLTLKSKGVRDVSFRIAFDPSLIAQIRLLRDLGFDSEKPVELGDVKIAPIDLVNYLAMRQEPPELIGALNQYELLRAVAYGSQGGRRMKVTADCESRGILKWGIGTDVDTGCPPSIAALMIASGEIGATGAMAPELAVPAESFFRHLARRSMRVKITKAGVNNE